MFKIWLCGLLGLMLTSGMLQITDSSVPLSIDNEIRIEEDVTSQDNASGVQPEFQLYADLVDVTEPVSQFIVDDIDMDGTRETVVVFGTGDSKAYCFKDSADEIRVLGQLDGKGYGTGEVKLVRLEDQIGQLIWIRITNGVSLNGFALYKLEEDVLKPFAYSASATGSGNDFIEDADQNGRIDGYVQNRNSYDVLYYPTVRQFSLQGGQFLQVSTYMDLGDYPTTPADAVEAFIKLTLIDEPNCPELAERVLSLNASGQELTLSDQESWIEGIVTGDLTLKEVAVADGRRVVASLDDVSLSFVLQQFEDQWRIVGIEQ